MTGHYEGVSSMHKVSNMSWKGNISLQINFGTSSTNNCPFLYVLDKDVEPPGRRDESEDEQLAGLVELAVLRLAQV